jgi:L-ascorbate metabolism protein UlaG (beta-lactamase superfamily)
MLPKVFGVHPSGRRQERIEKSPQYRDGIFHNATATEVMQKKGGSFGVAKKLLFPDGSIETIPFHDIHAVKVDLHTLPDDRPTVVWFGHSSYLIRYRGKNILVDPVFSGNASPVSMFVKAFAGTNTYSAADMPKIDILIITHDHYDHLDYQTVLELKPKTGHIYTALGVGAHLESWGFPESQISEFDWWESAAISENIKLTATPARHFSGRGLTRAKTLWASFVLELDHYKIYIGGDSGYDTHFKDIGEKFGPFDLAFMECGQYNEDWPLIHSFPEQTAQAAKDLGAKVMMPVHWSKFQLSLHPWTEPVERVSVAAAKLGVPLVTPRIGEVFTLGDVLPTTRWWTKP